LIIKFTGKWLSLDLPVGNNIYRFNSEGRYLCKIKSEDEAYFRNILSQGTTMYQEVSEERTITIFDEIEDTEGQTDLGTIKKEYPPWSGLRTLPKDDLIKAAKEYYDIDISPSLTNEEIKTIMKAEMSKKASIR
jgi:hypothetical protein